MGEVQGPKLADVEFKDLFSDNVQFGGKKIEVGKTRMSDKWSASKITENECEKYVISRQVSRQHKSHGKFTIEITQDQLNGDKLDDKTKTVMYHELTERRANIIKKSQENAINVSAEEATEA